MIERLIDRAIIGIRHNTTSIGELARQIFIMLMLFEIIHWTETQMLAVLSVISGFCALFTVKTTIAVVKMEQKVDEKVAHREMMGTTGTGNGMSTPLINGKNGDHK